jgi:hypothetical protein
MLVSKILEALHLLNSQSVSYASLPPQVGILTTSE